MMSAQGRFDGYNLALFNISDLRFPIDDERNKEFVDNLAPINAIAEKSPGFVWRLKDDSDAGGATDIRLYENQSIIVNYAVWKSVKELKKFTYQSDHMKFVMKGSKWMKKMTMKHNLVLFWIKDNEPIPSPFEAKKRLVMLNQNGPSQDAFTMAKLYKPIPYQTEMKSKL